MSALLGNSLFVGLLGAVMYMWGRHKGQKAGVAAERLRVLYLFERAFHVVSSGALRIVHNRIQGYTDDEVMRRELVEYADEKAKRDQDRPTSRRLA
jgi:hypothetical protein